MASGGAQFRIRMREELHEAASRKLRGEIRFPSAGVRYTGKLGLAGRLTILLYIRGIKACIKGPRVRWCPPRRPH